MHHVIYYFLIGLALVTSAPVSDSTFPFNPEAFTVNSADISSPNPGSTSTNENAGPSAPNSIAMDTGNVNSAFNGKTALSSNPNPQPCESTPTGCSSESSYLADDNLPDQLPSSFTARPPFVVGDTAECNRRNNKCMICSVGYQCYEMLALCEEGTICTMCDLVNRACWPREVDISKLPSKENPECQPWAEGCQKLPQQAKPAEPEKTCIPLTPICW